MARAASKGGNRHFPNHLAPERVADRSELDARRPPIRERRERRQRSQNHCLDDLRHTCATMLLSKGVHPKVVQELLGHGQISLTLDTYPVSCPRCMRRQRECWRRSWRQAEAHAQSGTSPCRSPARRARVTLSGPRIRSTVVLKSRFASSTAVRTCAGGSMIFTQLVAIDANYVWADIRVWSV